MTHSLTWVSPERNGSAPSVRNGHTADLIDSRIYVFGGGDKADLLGDLHVFDVRDHSWSEPPCTGTAPPPRSRHASATIDRNLYIWGGIGGGLEVHVLDTNAMDWSTPVVHGAVPDSRFGHTCVSVDAGHAPRLFILGGHNSRQALSDLHVLEVGEELTWTRPSVLGDAPICGNRHATVLVERMDQPASACLLVFPCDMHDTFGTLYALRHRDGINGNGLRWVAQPTAGKPPLSRARPSLVLLDEHIFLLCGVAAGKPLSSVVMLHTHTFTWSSPTMDGVPPQARMGASATRVGTDLYIFGGSDGKGSLRDLHVLVYVTWFTPSYGGRAPPARVGHTTNFVGPKLHMLGGASQGKGHNDLYVLDPTAQRWSRPPMYGTPPDALVGHSTVVVGTELIVWGGGDGKQAHAGLNVVDTVNMLWTRPTTSGSEPHAHVGHTAVHADAKMFIFGGYGHRQYWNELVVLDTGIMVWMRPHTTGSPPEPCVLHTATLVGNVMVVYCGAFDEVPLDQIVALDIAGMRWTDLGNFVWSGLRPAPRFGHGAVAMGTKLFVFGGTTGGVADRLSAYLVGSGFVTGYAAGARNELIVMDLQERLFSSPRYSGTCPAPAYRLCVSSYRGKIFVIGGVGSEGNLSLLDTGHVPSEAHARPGGRAASALDRAAAAAFAADATNESTVGGGFQGGRGLDATQAAEVVALLQDLGLNKYARLFLRQEVDVDSLLQLSDADLKDMGLAALGARRKLTAAIHRHKLQRLVDHDAVAPEGVAAQAAAASQAAHAKRNGPSSISSSDGKASGGGSGGGGSSGGGLGGSGGGSMYGGRFPVVAGEVYRDRYRMTGKTYIGGSARVVIGEDLKTGAPIAIKVHSNKHYFSREVKLLKQLHGEYVVGFLDAYDEEDSAPAIVLEGGSCSLAELIADSQLSPVERKHVFERLCFAVDHIHSKGFVLVDLKPQNLVVFGSLLSMKIIDLECLRKNGDPVPFKLTPFYAAPEIANAALETMRLGQLPPLEYSRDGASEGSDQWGPNLERLALLSENPTLARAVAKASSIAGRAGDGAVAFNRDEQRQLDAPLKMSNGKPLRASVAMDIWSLGLIAYELFTNEPFFAGCSDDVALQVLSSQAPLDLPLARIAEPQAQHLLAKILLKRPKDRASLDVVLRHAYLAGGLDTQEIGGSFAKLHEAQSVFKEELGRLKSGLGPGASMTSATAGGSSNVNARSSFKRGGSALTDKRAKFADSRGEHEPPPRTQHDVGTGAIHRPPPKPASVLEGAGVIPRMD